MNCVCGCGQRAVHMHHVVLAQTILRAGGDPFDPRWLVPVAFKCHGDHHTMVRRFPLSVIPDVTYTAAFELLGAAAYDHLRSRYVGEDPRLDALLGEEAA